MRAKWGKCGAEVPQGYTWRALDSTALPGEVPRTWRDADGANENAFEN
jgi:hypothetical protein